MGDLVKSYKFFQKGEREISWSMKSSGGITSTGDDFGELKSSTSNVSNRGGELLEGTGFTPRNNADAMCRKIGKGADLKIKPPESLISSVGDLAKLSRFFQKKESLVGSNLFDTTRLTFFEEQRREVGYGTESFGTLISIIGHLLSMAFGYRLRVLLCQSSRRR
jgi:hypothetical protein